MPNDSSKIPYVSVVMPVRNEADFIERSLQAVLAQDYPHESLEIIVADGLSTDETREQIKKLKKVSNIPINIIDNPERIAPSGLNRAIAKAKGEIIVRVDGHCEIEPNYVTNCVKYLVAGKAEGVGGPIETVGETRQAKAIAVAMSSTFGVGGSAFRCVNDREMYVDTVAFPGYKREVLEKAGAFNEELVRNQDDEFNYRIRKSGGRILLAPDIRSRYFSRSTFKSLWRQYFQYGFWKIRVLQLHPKQMSLRQFIPFIFVSTVLFLSLLSVFSVAARWTLILVFGLYLLANVAATLKAMSRINLSALPFVFLSFPILHFSYGLGFIAGIFAFWRRWRET
jgi:succinoglycan biosynthesis protein ExoA